MSNDPKDKPAPTPARRPVFEVGARPASAAAPSASKPAAQRASVPSQTPAPAPESRRPPIARLLLGSIAVLILYFVGVAVVAGKSMLPRWVPGIHQSLPPIGERSIGTTGFYVAAILDGTLYGWGGAFHGSLRAYDPNSRDEVMAPVPIDADAASSRYVYAGRDATYAITARNELLRRSVGGWYPEVKPLKPVFTDTSWLKVREAKGQTVGLTMTGQLYMWSEARMTECDKRPDLVALGLCKIEPLTSRSDWVDFCVNRTKENAYAWGFWAYAVDSKGQLWRMDPTMMGGDPWEPRKVTRAKGIARVVCSEKSGAVLYLDRSQRLWSFADQEGFKSLEAVEPKLVSRRKWLIVSAANGLAAGVASDRSLWAWGPFYEKITGKPGGKLEPVLVDGTRAWAEVDVGDNFLVASTVQHEVYTAGFNNCAAIANCGVLGAGPVSVHSTPQPVTRP